MAICQLEFSRPRIPSPLPLQFRIWLRNTHPSRDPSRVCVSYGSVIFQLGQQMLRIISGGQTGVDRAALDAAMQLGIRCGGFCPKGRKSEDGIIPEKYPLIE